MSSPSGERLRAGAQLSWCESLSRTSLTSLCCRGESGESPLVWLKMSCVNTLLSLSTHGAWVCVCSVSKMELFKRGYPAIALSSVQPVLGGTPACLRSALHPTFSPEDGGVCRGVHILLGPHGPGLFSPLLEKKKILCNPL